MFTNLKRQFDEFSSSFSDPKWLQSYRQKSFTLLSTQGYPSSKDEDYLGLNFQGFRDMSFSFSKEELRSVDLGLLQELEVADFKTPQIVFVNGQYSSLLSNTKGLSEDIEITTLEEALSQNSDLLGHFIDKESDLNQSSVFDILNGTFLKNGLLIHFKKNAMMDEPLQIKYVTCPFGDALMTNLRVLVLADEGAHGSIIESFSGVADKAYFSNPVFQAVVKNNATIHYYKIQHESLAAMHVSKLAVKCGRDARFNAFVTHQGSKLARQDISISLDDTGAHASVNGLTLANHDQQIDLHTTVTHHKPHGESQVIFKGILDGQSRGIFNAKTVVQADAQKTNAHQSNKTLLLSKTASADPRPQLEIYANDVKCGHGATVGQLDDAQMFYLRSRGMPESQAKALLTRAFANDILATVKIQALQSHIEKLVVQKLCKLS